MTHLKNVTIKVNKIIWSIIGVVVPQFEVSETNTMLVPLAHFKGRD